jgi:hypothetical protein
VKRTPFSAPRDSRSYDGVSAVTDNASVCSTLREAIGEESA